MSRARIQLLSLRGTMAVIDTPQAELDYYAAQGYVGSLADKRRQYYYAKLTLTDPTALQYTNNDLKFMWLGSLGYTGSVNDREYQWRLAGATA